MGVPCVLLFPDPDGAQVHPHVRCRAPVCAGRNGARADQAMSRHREMHAGGVVVKPPLRDGSGRARSSKKRTGGAEPKPHGAVLAPYLSVPKV